MVVTGRIIEEQKNFYIANTPGGDVRVVTRGVLKLKKTRICTGDFVDIELTNADTSEGIVTNLHERSTFLKRPPLANISQVLLVTTFKEPRLDLEALDRFLVCIAAYGIVPVLVVNKTDLHSSTEEEFASTVIDAYKKAGYKTLVSSAETGIGLDELTGICTNQLSAFAGLSGVGKTTLLSKLFPDRDLRIGEVSVRDGRGTHTTTSVILLPLPGGGFIADTPGLSFVDLPLVPEEDVATYFPEISAMIGRCRFNNCIHENEPGCNVLEAVENGEIADWRYEHYLKIFMEMRERRRGYREKEKR
jgi:ribosome biogenesis GTPase / thiamine phosphate phosphatase